MTAFTVTNCSPRRTRPRTGFTLIEVLIVSTVMLIVAAAAIPQFSGSTYHAKKAAVAADVHVIRTAIEAYRTQHDGRPPRFQDGSLPQLFVPTNSRGVPGPRGAAHPCGPYLLGSEMPVNPITGSRVVTEIATFPPKFATGGGWLYHQPSGWFGADALVKANQTLDEQLDLAVKGAAAEAVDGP